MTRFTRREFLSSTAAGGMAALAAAGPLGRIPPALGQEAVRAVTWGGPWLDGIKAVTDKGSPVPVNWYTYQAGASEIVAQTKAVWPNPSYDLCANWDPVYLQLHGEGWLESVTLEEVPNLADIPDSLLVYRDDKGMYGIPYSIAALYWGYRTDLVDIEIRDIPDLLHPSLKGKVCIGSAVKHSNTTVASFALAYGGSEKNMAPGWDFLKKLAESGNIGRIALSEIDFVNSLNTGETAVGFWNSAGWNAVKENWPVEVLTRVPGSKGMKTIFAQEGWAIFKTPRAPQAKQLVNYLLAPENNEAYNFSIGQAPVNSKAKAPPQAADYAFTSEEYQKFGYFPDFAVIAKEHDGWIKYWEKNIQPIIRAG